MLHGVRNGRRVSGALIFERVRRSLTGVGDVVIASVVPRAAEGRPEEFRLAPSQLLEDAVLTTRSVGAPCPCSEPLAFLDGTQRYEIVGYSGTLPVVAAVLGAAVRLRIDGRLRTVERLERRILVGRPAVLAMAAGAADGFDLVALPGTADVHPLQEIEEARRAVDSARAALERAVGRRFRERHDHWLVVDGVLSDTDLWTSDARAIGVSKSHATLPFAGAALQTYLSLPPGHRTSVFEPATWRFAPVHSWALRLWPFVRKDLLHGLVRIEVAATDGSIGRADEISRWIAAERVPLARPDPRWDRLLYGIATVERHLRAR